MNVLLGSAEAAGAWGAETDVYISRGARDAEEVLAQAARGEARVLVFWSFYSSDAGAAAAELARWRQWERAAELRPAVHVAGGVHATAEPLQTLQMGFDAAALGEGEQLILQIVSAIRGGGDLKGISGIRYLQNGAVAGSGHGERVELDDHPPFCAARERFNAIEITRGCIYACKFCQTPFMFKARFRHRSVENITMHISAMRRAGLADVRFLTPTSLSYGSQDESVNLMKIEELLARAKEAIGPGGRIFFGTFPSELRPEHVSPPALAILKNYVSNDNLVIGGQSGSERMLQSSSRGHDAACIERAVRICNEFGFKANVDFIFGFPGETADDAAASIDLAEKLTSLGARIHAHAFMPLPGTPWRAAAPATIDAGIVRRLERLASRSELYGQWKQQMIRS